LAGFRATLSAAGSFPHNALRIRELSAATQQNARTKRVWALRTAAEPRERISVADVGLRCYPCFNEETAALMGVAFDHTPLQPVTVRDVDGVEHTFEFRSMLVPTGHALSARERVSHEQEGYEFSVLGDFDANVWDLFRVLYDRIRDGLAVRHVEQGELGWQITDARHLVGRITWDPERAGEVPLVVIDGKPFTWDAGPHDAEVCFRRIRVNVSDLSCGASVGSASSNRMP
jgi:hypothetical protein